MMVGQTVGLRVATLVVLKVESLGETWAVLLVAPMDIVLVAMMGAHSADMWGCLSAALMDILMVVVSVANLATTMADCLADAMAVKSAVLTGY